MMFQETGPIIRGIAVDLLASYVVSHSVSCFSFDAVGAAFAGAAGASWNVCRSPRQKGQVILRAPPAPQRAATLQSCLAQLSQSVCWQGDTAMLPGRSRQMAHRRDSSDVSSLSAACLPPLLVAGASPGTARGTEAYTMASFSTQTSRSCSSLAANCCLLLVTAAKE